MPSPSPEDARKAIGVSMPNDHAALEALRAALVGIAGVRRLAARTGHIFVSASFCVDPEIAATPYVPIPLHPDLTRATIRISKGFEKTLLRYQRALLNVSRSMQLADWP